MDITYPLYLAPHGGGYASIVDPQSDSVQLLVVYTDEQAAAGAHHQPGVLRERAGGGNLDLHRRRARSAQHDDHVIVGVTERPYAVAAREPTMATQGAVSSATRPRTSSSAGASHCAASTAG